MKTKGRERMSKMSTREAKARLSEIIAGHQPDALAAIEDVADRKIEEMTIGELIDFIIESAEPLNPFWR